MERTEPKIMLYDLETMPDLDAAMEVFTQLSQYPGLTLKAEINSIICFGYREYGKGIKAKCKSVWDMPGWKGDINDDKEICEFIVSILDTADCVVTFNGKRFDEKFIATRCAIHGLEFPMKIKHVDLYQVVKANFSFFRNNLKTSAKILTNEFKMSHEGWGLWVKVRKLIRSSMREMVAYCKQDVDVMEPMFKRLRPRIKGIPDHNLFQIAGSKHLCTKCGSSRHHSHGWVYSAAYRKKRFKCVDCKSVRTETGKGEPRNI